jgi:hypothetical protein
MSDSNSASSSSSVSTGATTPFFVPLYVFPFSEGYKIGIRVSFDAGAHYHMFEFDTGGTGFWSAFDAQWWPTPTIVGDPLNIQYSSGIQYTANPAEASITLENAPVAISAVVGQITLASKATGNNQFTPETWNHDVATGVAPLYGNFWGDFGVALGSGNAPLFAVLPQIGSGLAAGFIVDLGPYPATGGKNHSGNWVQQGSLQIGLTPADIAAFKTQIPMQGSSAGTAAPTTFPNSGLPTYTELLGQGTLQVSLGAAAAPFAVPTGLVFDTGAPTAEIHTGTVITQAGLSPYLAQQTDNSDLANTVQLSLSAPAASGDEAWALNVTVGTQSGQNEVGTTSLDVNDAHPTGYVNTGLIPFFGNRVMFNVAGGTIGFAPHS